MYYFFPNKEAVIEVLSSILLEEISADVSKEPVVEWPGNSLSEIAGIFNCSKINNVTTFKSGI